MEKIDVLVIGAGPTGLTLAADLLRRGLQVRLIEKQAKPSDKSRAFGIQAGTLEALESTFGPELSEQFVSLGRAARRAFVHLDDQKPISVDLSPIEGKYNFVLILEQTQTERLLLEEFVKRGGVVEYCEEIQTLEQFPDQVLCEISVSGKQSQKIAARYIVGCDGAHSVVRHLAGIDFRGQQYQGNFILGDVSVEWPFSDGDIHTFISAQGVLACFPFPQSQKYRMILIPKAKDPHFETPEIGLGEFSRIAKKLVPCEIRISEPLWLTRFKVHHRIAQTFYRGRVFLAGDAAHIHSPAGGQGMNTGIQDALNLAEKIASILLNEQPTSLFEDYGRERMVVAKKILRGTDRITRLGILPEGFLSGFLRSRLLPPLIKNKFFQRKMVRAMSQVNIARHEIEMRSKRAHDLKRD